MFVRGKQVTPEFASSIESLVIDGELLAVGRNDYG
jgi:hypothetical protein